MSARNAPAGPIKLLISDVDGTLVTPDKVISPLARAAVRALSAAGVAFSVVSARPPRGLAKIAATLGLQLPYAAFNGGSLVSMDGDLIGAERLAVDTARTILKHLAERGIDAWVFAGDSWRLKDPAGPEVGRERKTVGFGPVVVSDFDDVIDQVDKIVGVCRDPILLSAVETEAPSWSNGRALVQRSQAYYLDFTAPLANKGHAVGAICEYAGIETAQTAVIGDMSNDLAMFRAAGFSIAMGQAPDAVKAEADVVTDANSAEGFAHAVERFVLTRAAEASSG